MKRNQNGLAQDNVGGQGNGWFYGELFTYQARQAAPSWGHLLQRFLHHVLYLLRCSKLIYVSTREKLNLLFSFIGYELRVDAFVCIGSCTLPGLDVGHNAAHLHAWVHPVSSPSCDRGPWLSDRCKVGSRVAPFPVWIGSAGRGALPVGGLRCMMVYIRVPCPWSGSGRGIFGSRPELLR